MSDKVHWEVWSDRYVGKSLCGLTLYHRFFAQGAERVTCKNCIAEMKRRGWWRPEYRVRLSLLAERTPVSWHRPPQHFHYRGVPSLAMLVQRIRSGLTTERDAWRVLGLMSKLDRVEGALHGARGAIEVWRTERDFWREQCRRRDLDDGHLRQRLYEANHLITEAYVLLEMVEPNHPLVDKLEAWPGGEEADDDDQT